MESDEGPGPQLRGEAFCQLLERYPAGRLPATGGVNATVVVTIPLDTLLGGLRAAGILGTDVSISAGEARRMACAAGVMMSLPVVIVVLSAQRYLVRGLTLGAVKG